MTNKKDALIILLLVILASFFGYGDFIHKSLISTNNNIKTDLIHIQSFVKSDYKKHIKTVKIIDKLEKETISQKIIIAKLQLQIKELLRDINETSFKKNKNYKFIPAQAISYVKFGNPNQLYLDANITTNDIRALVYKDYVAGIVKKNQHNNLIAYLSGDSKCSYAVFIGKNKISAIVESSSKNHLLQAKYIPLWQKINIGDTVISSGLDGYFYEGYKVGKVVSLNSHETYQVAFIKPYIVLNNKKNFLILDRNDYISNKPKR